MKLITGCSLSKYKCSALCRSWLRKITLKGGLHGPWTRSEYGTMRQESLTIVIALSRCIVDLRNRGNWRFVDCLFCGRTCTRSIRHGNGRQDRYIRRGRQSFCDCTADRPECAGLCREEESV